jgi:GT2 family glycosyltransferase
MAPALISCIVPVFNGERYLGEALDSIRAQTYRPHLAKALLGGAPVNWRSTDEGTTQIHHCTVDTIKYERTG